MGYTRKQQTSKLVVNVTVNLLEQIDKYAEEMNINRTSAVSVLLTQALSSQETLNSLSKFIEIYESEMKKQELQKNAEGINEVGS